MIGKKFLPKSLFGRALLILVLPTVLIQLVTAFIFFDRHWENVIRHMSGTLAGEIAFLVHQVEATPPGKQPETVDDFDDSTGIDVFSDPLSSFKPDYETAAFPEFQERLRARIDNPFTVRTIEGGNMIEIRIRLKNRVLRLQTTIKRLESRTTTLFVLWMIGASVLFLLIAVIFLRNQIRPIRKLAEAADSFGRGVDITNFRPSGATEVRKAARAFIIMRERIKRQIKTRTEMLAGISHDLRTPLTRMKLQLAMLSDKEAKEELGDDVQQMEHMIQEYLDFARGEGREEAVSLSVRELMEGVVSDYARMNAAVTLTPGDDVQMALRKSSLHRLLHNLIDNALRYGTRCTLSLKVSASYCEILVDDVGPGIPEDQREEVFKPFSRLEASRNVKTGGVGLGLTIARDIALAHGGGITLTQAPGGGLRVIVRLPL